MKKIPRRRSFHQILKLLLLAGIASSQLLPTVSAQDVDKVYLTPAMATSVENFLDVNTNLNFEGNPISISGQQFERGLGVHAPSSIEIPLNGKYATFHVVAGPDDANAGLLEMKILVDGNEVWSSGQVTSRKYAATPLDLPVAGAKTLTLIVDECGDNGGDHASWGDAYLVPAANP